MLRVNWRLSVLLVLAGGVGYSLNHLPGQVAGDAKGLAPKPATEATKAANAAFAKSLPFTDVRDIADARRGLIADLPDGGIVKNAAGVVVWDPSKYAFIKLDQASPETVNPSLWRQAQLIALKGLFKLTENIYQIRGYDLSNITFIEGKDGVTIVDPLICKETAKASLDLYYAHRPKKPVVAVVYTHSHVDHFGGVKGVTSEADVKAGKVKIIAPEHFTEEAVSENVMAGNAMSRRATYMYGPLLPKGPTGQMTSGLGLTTSGGETTLIAPTDFVTKTGQKMVIDGLTYEFLMAPGSEAPSEMHFFIPEYKALCTAENSVHTLHNMYTLRGAKTRDSKKWFGYLTQTLDMWGDKAEVLFAPHHWPTWGNAAIVEHVTKYRDTLKYLHDQTLRLANHGYTMDEIAEQIKLPPSLEANWSSHGYYGSVNHNVKSIYNFYLGWFNANPATLNQLPPADAARKYVEYMGGANAILAKAKADFDRGEYRWVAHVVNQVVLADPTNRQARELQADTLEQLGYQTENGTWRNFYLTGVQELRHGVVRPPAVANTGSGDMIQSMSLEMFLDYLGVRLNGPKAAGKKIVINMVLPDVKQKALITIENGVLIYAMDKQSAKADTTLTIDRSSLNEVIAGTAKMPKLIADGKVTVAGDVKALQEFLSLLDSFDLWFEIVTANPPRKQ